MTDREVITIVATKIMNWHKEDLFEPDTSDYDLPWRDNGGDWVADWDWDPLNSIEDAWMVAEKIHERLVMTWSNDEERAERTSRWSRFNSSIEDNYNLLAFPAERASRIIVFSALHAMDFHIKDESWNDN